MKTFSEKLFCQTQYKNSFPILLECPYKDNPWILFVGRSNVGKSSLINHLCNHKNLAYISNAPGKTQCMAFFEVPNTAYLIDTPGYGYARRNRALRNLWLKRLEKAIHHSQCVLIFLVIDIRISLTTIDKKMCSYLHSHERPFVIVLTKNDKLSWSQTNIRNQKFQNELKNHIPLPEIYMPRNGNSAYSDIRSLIMRLKKQSAKGIINLP